LQRTARLGHESDRKNNREAPLGTKRETFARSVSTDAFALLSRLDLNQTQKNSNKKQSGDGDLALAKALQEQEHAFMLLASSSTTTAAGEAAPTARGGAGAGAGGGARGAGGPGDDGEEGGAAGEEEALGDEALAWKLQEEMERDHMLALAGMLPGQRRDFGGEEGAGGEGEEGRAGGEDEREEEQGEDEEEEDEDPAALSYERLTALTDIVGIVPKKACASALSRIVVGPYRPRRGAAASCGKGKGEEEKDADKGGEEEGEEGEEQCAVCRVELERGEDAATLPCGHAYHEGCVLAWLERAKSCPVCGVELQ